MSGEEFADKSAGIRRAEGVGDEEMRRRVIGAFHRGFICGYFLQRGGEALRIAREKRPRGIGEKFAPTRNRKLHEPCGDGGEYDRDNRKDGEEHARAIVPIVVSPEVPHAEEYVGEYRYKPDEDDGNCHD